MSDLLKARRRLRRFGLFYISSALVMVLAGVSVLGPVLEKSRLGFVLYWLACLGLTLLAMLAAILDVARLRWQSRQEQRLLLETTLREVEEEKAARKKSNHGRQ